MTARLAVPVLAALAVLVWPTGPRSRLVGRSGAPVPSGTHPGHRLGAVLRRGKVVVSHRVRRPSD